MAGVSTKTCKSCRRLGMSVCGRLNCAFKRKPYPPGVHGKSRSRGLSEFGTQLREKQKLKLSYGLRERQFKNYLFSAIKQKAMNTAEAVLYYLESRLDNFVFKMGLASTRSAARQIVNHGHILVNGKKITIPSYRVKVGDEISIRNESRARGVFKDLTSTLKKHEPPVWISLDKEKIVGRVISVPQNEALKSVYNINAIVEYYLR
ncbi:MAG: 30S ribosomal protein S4 [Patescibacteria group bacterium]|mgnify:CR=1 FL=1